MLCGEVIVAQNCDLPKPCNIQNREVRTHDSILGRDRGSSQKKREGEFREDCVPFVISRSLWRRKGERKEKKKLGRGEKKGKKLEKRRGGVRSIGQGVRNAFGESAKDNEYYRVPWKVK